MIDKENGAFDEMRIGRGNRNIRRKPATVSLYSQVSPDFPQQFDYLSTSAPYACVIRSRYDRCI
jgi:hypothetical protein